VWDKRGAPTRDRHHDPVTKDESKWTGKPLGPGAFGVLVPLIGYSGLEYHRNVSAPTIADAHLIAAAPDLYEVVRGVAGIRDGCCGLAKDPLAACIHDHARTVLAKAKSES